MLPNRLRRRSQSHDGPHLGSPATCLLPQPHGFEGLGPVEVLLPAVGLALSEAPDLPGLLGRLHAAATSPTLHLDAIENGVFGVLELRWPDVKLLPRFHPSDEVAP